MSWQELGEDVRRAAETVLTTKQLAAYRLSMNGFSDARIAVLLNVSRRAVRDRLLAADIKIGRELNREEAA